MEHGGKTECTGIVEEERIVRFCIFHQPVHSAQDVRFRGLTHRVLLVVGQDDHVFSGIAKVAIEVCGHVLDVVDAASELTSLAKVVDANKKCLASTGAIRVLKGIALGSAVAEALHRLRRWSRRMATLHTLSVLL